MANHRTFAATATVILLYGLTAASAFTPSPSYSSRLSVRQHAATLDGPAAKKSPKKPKKEKITKEAQELMDVLKLEGDDRPFIVAQIAPAVRVAIPEEFGQEPGTFQVGNLIQGLKDLGFDLVLDTNTAADLTIMEEGTELLARIKSHIESPSPSPFGQLEKGENAPMPLFTSCCPGWMAYIEKSEPELAPYISTCKSPHMMFGAFLKKYSQELYGREAKDVYFMSVMPCVRKRGESDKEVFIHDGVRDVDNVVTTKDIGLILRKNEIDLPSLEPAIFDSPFQMDGIGTGAGALFGATGGVMEAAVRTVYEIVTGETMPRMELDAVRGLAGVKEATLSLGNSLTKDGSDLELKVCVCSGLGNAKKLIKEMKAGNVHYDFIEVMACPGGCINGGGQPKSADKEAVSKRLESIYKVDRDLPLRKSHDNPNVKAIYSDDFVGEIGSHESHDLFHVQPVYGGFEIEE